MKEDLLSTSGKGNRDDIRQPVIYDRNVSDQSGIKNVVQCMLLGYREFREAANPGAIRRARIRHG
jgi:hypothetical protein